MSEEKRSALNGLDLLDNIEQQPLIEFVCMCSRFEYALKQVSEYRMKRGEKITVCWKRYSREYDAKIRKNASLLTPIHEYEKQTIKKQVIDESDNLKWIDDDTSLILMMVYRVRNNLFHGGKENNKNTSRNVELLIAGSQILDVAWTLNADVKRAYKRV